jgi:hypothetical protein
MRVRLSPKLRRGTLAILAALIAVAAGCSLTAVASATIPATLAALDSYWADIAAGKYAAAYEFYAPGAATLSSPQFVASERNAHITTAQFRGSVVANNGATATILVSALKTIDRQYGCRNWTGTYSMVRENARWLITRSNITPHACPSSHPSSPPSAATSVTGTVHDFNGDKLQVTVSIYGDPATPATQFDSPSSGTTLVAIKETLTDEGPRQISDDANSDTTIVGSNGQVYTFASNSIRGCTNFDYGSYTLTRGESETGCVAFLIPNGVGLKRLAFTLTDGSVDTAEWTIVS